MTWMGNGKPAFAKFFESRDEAIEPPELTAGLFYAPFAVGSAVR
jgi:hypothetical protein